MVVFWLQHNGPKLHWLGNKAAGGTAAQGPSLNLKRPNHHIPSHGDCAAHHTGRVKIAELQSLFTVSSTRIYRVFLCISRSWRITHGPIAHIPLLEHPFFLGIRCLSLSASSLSFSWPHLLCPTLASKGSSRFKTEASPRASSAGSPSKENLRAINRCPSPQPLWG